MRLECWYSDVEELMDPVRFSEGMKRLPFKERRERLLRFRMEKDRALSLGAGLLLKKSLREFGAVDLTLRENEHGKPYLARHNDIHFNLSHSGTIAVCAVSDCPVGVDTEQPQQCREGVARRFFTKDEVDYVRNREDRDKAFIKIWVRKESYLKLLGLGLSKAPESFSVLTGEGMAEGYRFYEKEAKGQQICVCTMSPDALEDISLRNVPCRSLCYSE